MPTKGLKTVKCCRDDREVSKCFCLRISLVKRKFRPRLTILKECVFHVSRASEGPSVNIRNNSSLTWSTRCPWESSNMSLPKLTWKGGAGSQKPQGFPSLSRSSRYIINTIHFTSHKAHRYFLILDA